MPDEFHKFPRTPHLEGSRLQPGDEDLAQVPFSAIAGKTVVVTEKLDGANAAISFSSAGELRLQSRGHYLAVGGRERHFDLLKTWAAAHADGLLERLEDRYVLYGEWLYAKHTVFYDALPHYLLAFDVLDTATGAFLDTAAGSRLLDGSPVVAVPRVFAGRLRDRNEVGELLGRSRFITPRADESLTAACRSAGLDVGRVRAQTDLSGQVEGLYLKVEEGGRVVQRLKFVRSSFLTQTQAESHWQERPLVPNQLAPGVDIFR